MTAALPAATGAFGDKPTLTFPAEPAPAELVVHMLERGTGDLVEAGQDIEVNYLGQIWGGSVFDSSYDRGESISFPIGVGMVIAGWDDALVGQPIGSRLLLSRTMFMPELYRPVEKAIGQAFAPQPLAQAVPAHA